MLKLCHSSYYKHTYFHSQIVACDKNIIYEKLAQRWEREKKNEKWIEKKIYASMHVIALEMYGGKSNQKLLREFGYKFYWFTLEFL